MSEEEIGVAIIGGGPCGLATALALAKAPCLQGCGRIAIFEKDEFELSESRVRISQNGWAALEAIDADTTAAIRDTGVEVNSVKFMSFAGDILNTFKSKSTSIYRWHDVRSALRRSVSSSLPDALRSGHELIAISEENDAVTLRFSTGSGETEVRAKLVLACDGTHSTVRALSPDPACLLDDEGKSIWRGTAPTVDCEGVSSLYRSAGVTVGVNPAGLHGASWTVIAAAVESFPPETRNSKSQTPNPKPQTLSPKSQTSNPTHHTSNLKPQNPKPKTQSTNPRPQPQNPKPQTLNPKT